MNKNILIIQTAFLGDVILTLPVIQVLKKNIPDSKIDFLCIPKTSQILKNNPYINEIIIYDKKKSNVNDSLKLINRLKRNKYDMIISPHRSFRTALISYLSCAKKSISFDKSSLSFLYDIKIPYEKKIHEIKRNLNLLESSGIITDEIVKPELFPGKEEADRINKLFVENKISTEEKIIIIAPGTVWKTKRFPEEKFVRLCDLLKSTDIKIILIGGEEDKKISAYIITNSQNKNLINATGDLSILESTELIKRAALLITNDSAPLHIANSAGIKVIAIYGATVPSFGFYPYGKNDIVIETHGLSCRPCSIHGGNKCPVGTFDCMMKISEENISDEVKKILS